MANLPDIDPSLVSPHRGVTVPQAFTLAHLAVQLLGLPWPQNRREASILISELYADVEAGSLPSLARVC